MRVDIGCRLSGFGLGRVSGGYVRRRRRDMEMDMCEEGFWFSFVWGGPENELDRLLFVFLYSPRARQPASQPVIRAAYSPSLCPIFGNHPGLPYPDKVISKGGHPHPAERVSSPCRAWYSPPFSRIRPKGFARTRSL